MKNFLLGIIVGLAIGTVTISFASQIIGGDGWLMGWDVSYNGDTICSDPYIWTSVREIECS